MDGDCKSGCYWCGVGHNLRGSAVDGVGELRQGLEVLVCLFDWVGAFKVKSKNVFLLVKQNFVFFLKDA